MGVLAVAPGEWAPQFGRFAWRKKAYGCRDRVVDRHLVAAARTAPALPPRVVTHLVPVPASDFLGPAGNQNCFVVKLRHGSRLRNSAVSERPETPSDLLERIRGEVHPEAFRYGPPRPSLRVLEIANVPPAEREGYLENFEAQQAARTLALLEQVTQGLQAEVPEMREFLRDERAVLAAAHDVGDLNARTLAAENGGWLIVFNQGLVTFIYKAARSMATRIQFAPSNATDPIDLSGALSLEQVADLFISMFEWYRVVGVPFGPDFPIRDEQLRFASRLTAESEKFILAHEVAHHVLGHTRAGTRSLSVSDTVVQELDVDRRDELDADALAIRMALESISSSDGVSASHAYAGAELVFQVMTLFEEYDKTPEVSSHPPARERLDHLRTALLDVADARSVPIVRDLADAIADFMAILKPYVLDPERREQLMARQHEFEELLRPLVDRFAPIRPRHRGFADAVRDLELQFLPEVLEGGLADEICRNQRLVDAGGDQADIAVQRLTLLLGFASNHPVLRDAVSERLPGELGT